MESDTTYLFINLRTPPFEVAHPARVHNTKKDDNDTKSKSRIQGGAQHHIVFLPPLLASVLDLVVEDVANNGPHGKVQSSRGRNPTQTAENYGWIDFAQDRSAIVASEVPDGDG